MTIEEGHLAPQRMPDARSAPVVRNRVADPGAPDAPGIVHRNVLLLFRRAGCNTGVRISCILGTCPRIAEVNRGRWAQRPSVFDGRHVPGATAPFTASNLNIGPVTRQYAVRFKHVSEVRIQ